MLDTGTVIHIQCVGTNQLLGTLYMPTIDNGDLTVMRTMNITTSSIPQGCATPSIVIGENHLWEIWGEQPTQSLPSGKILITTRMGPVLSGQLKTPVRALCTYVENEAETLDQKAVEIFRSPPDSNRKNIRTASI
ncbi:unnamed protein product [Auanema sp. JU1783]|nr:unnamed protein product [Auanema sp. JU1783]